MAKSHKIVKKIPIYFMPGMAASSKIFEYIKLPSDLFEPYFLEWAAPGPKRNLRSYAKEIAQNIKHNDPVLVGVSFGGILVQEMAKIIPVKRIVIVSSVKHHRELPLKMLLARYTNVHKLLPTGLVDNLPLLAKYAFGGPVARRLEMYRKYMAVPDAYYMDWCLNQMVKWKQDIVPPNLIHIHGEKDTVFPIDNIADCIRIPNATHTMILHRARWFNEQLPRIIMGRHLHF